MKYTQSHREARLAALLWPDRLEKEDLGEMDLWDLLDANEKKLVRRELDLLERVEREQEA